MAKGTFARMPRSLIAALSVATVGMVYSSEQRRLRAGSRGPVQSSGKKRGGGRGGLGEVMRPQLKIKRIKGVSVARPRHASSTWMGPREEASR